MIYLWVTLAAVWAIGFGYLLRISCEAESLGWRDTSAAVFICLVWPVLLLVHGVCGLFLENYS
jgi:hypothetical protein